VTQARVPKVFPRARQKFHRIFSTRALPILSPIAPARDEIWGVFACIPPEGKEIALSPERSKEVSQVRSAEGPREEFEEIGARLAQIQRTNQTG